MPGRRWPTQHPLDRKAITDGTLIHTPEGEIKIARRCKGCRELYLVSWSQGHASRPVQCRNCKNPGNQGLQEGN